MTRENINWALVCLGVLVAVVVAPLLLLLGPLNRLATWRVTCQPFWRLRLPWLLRQSRSLVSWSNRESDRRLDQEKIREAAVEAGTR